MAQKLLYYTRAFEEEYFICIVDECILVIVNDTISSNILAASCRTTYLRYVSACKKMIDHKVVLSLLVELNKDAPAKNILAITYLDDPSFYISSEQNRLLMNQAADTFSKNDYTPALSTQILFYRYTRALLDGLHARHLQQEKEKFPTFALFLGKKIH